MLMFSMYIICFMYNLLYCFLFCKYVLKEKFIVNRKMIINCGILAIFLSLNFYYDNSSMKPFISHIIEFLAIKLSYNESFVKSLIGLLISFLIVSLSELLFVIIVINGLNISQVCLNDNSFGFVLSNSIIILFALIISNLENVKRFLNIVISSFTDRRKFLSTIVVFFSLTLVSFIIYQNISKDGSITYFIFTNLFLISIYLFMIGFFVQKSNNNRLTSKYDQLIDYSKTYEQELVKRSKKQHEYKNQLVIIKSMIESKDKTVVDYINGILNDNDKNKDTKWLTRLTNIPLGGLKGLLYYKINEMSLKGIKVDLYVAETLNKKSLWKNYSDYSNDISKIIGVYIDNAIEAASSTNKKEIEIQFYIEDDNIVLCIGNTFTGEVDLTKIDSEGYSTKGNNRGYGLPLANDLLAKYKDVLSSERTIIDNYYVQKLMIKTK